MGIRLLRPLLALLLAFGCTVVVPARGALAEPAQIPVNIGVGPAFFNITGPVAQDQQWHYGLRLSLVAVIDQETLAANQGRVPARYRRYISQVDEVRINPFIFIPDTLILSPRVENTSIFGATWRPISINLPLIRTPVRFKVGAGAILTYAWIDSTSLDARTTHFLRPGIDLEADLEIPFSRSFLINFGWSSRFHLPQGVGGRLDHFPGFDGTSLMDSIWHWGTAYAMLNVRFPVSMNL